MLVWTAQTTHLWKTACDSLAQTRERHRYTIDSIAHGMGLETAIFHTPMPVAPDVISQHFRTNLSHAILVPNKTIFSKREQEVMDKMYCCLK